MAGYDGMDPTLHERIDQMMADAPGNVGLVSGYRTHDQQAALYAKNSKIAAAPGHSNHEKGLAADLSFADGATREWVHANAAKYGLFFPMSWEPWHVEAVGLTRTNDPQAYTAAPATTAAPASTNPLDRVGHLMDIVLGKHQVGQGDVTNPTSGGQLGAAVGGGLDYDSVYQLAIDQGAAPEEAAFLASVAQPESGYVPTKHNTDATTEDDSYGLLQINMLGQMGKDRAKQFGLSSYDDLYDPATNVRAGLAILRSQGKEAWHNSLPKINTSGDWSGPPPKAQRKTFEPDTSGMAIPGLRQGTVERNWDTKGPR